MANNIIQKYFHRVAARFRNFNFWKLTKEPKFAGGSSGRVGDEGPRRALEYILSVGVPDADGNQVVKRFTVDDFVNDDGTPKKIWINLHFHAAKPVDK